MKIKKILKSDILNCLLMASAGLLLGFLLIGLFIFTDNLEEHPAALRDGQTIDLTPFGFSLQVPGNFSLSDLTEAGSSRLTLALGNEQDSFYIYCYPNEERDSIEDCTHLDMVRFYMQSGCDLVRPRTLGGRTFISYRAIIESMTGNEDWYVYETWDPSQHLIFETRMLPASFLPIITTIQFAEPVNRLPAETIQQVL